MEDLYKGLFAQFDEDVSAANPYGCNQYGHRGGHQGGTGKASVDMEQRKKQVEDRKKRISDAKRALSNHKKNVYNPAYVRVHGMDDEPTEKDWKAFEDADNERRRLEYELEKLESESETTPGTSDDKGVADGKLDEATRKRLNVDKEKQKIIGNRYFQYGGASQEKYAKASRFYDVLDDVAEMVRSGPGKEKLRDVPDIELKQKLMSEYLNDKDANVFKMEHNTIDVRRPSFVYDKSAAKDWVNKHRDNVINYF